MSSAGILRELDQLDTESEDFASRLGNIVQSQDGFNSFASQLYGVERKQLLDLLDKALDSNAFRNNGALFRRGLRFLKDFCGEASDLPTSHFIDEKALCDRSEWPVNAGGSADVYTGSYKSRVVAIKQFRIYGQDDDWQKTKKIFCEEVVVWKRFSHPNVLSLVGVSKLTIPFYTVSYWMENGDLNNYLKKNPASNRLQLLLEIAQGLEYLHDNSVIHGDLKGANIVVDAQGHPLLTDFGLSSIMVGPTSIISVPGGKGAGGTARWMAPELSDPLTPENEAVVSAKADIYAFAMVVIEAFTGDPPFVRIRKVTHVVQKVLNGERPMRPEGTTTLGLTDEVWKIVEACWKQDPKSRMRAFEVVSGFQNAISASAKLRDGGSTQRTTGVKTTASVSNHAPLTGKPGPSGTPSLAQSSSPRAGPGSTGVKALLTTMATSQKTKKPGSNGVASSVPARNPWAKQTTAPGNVRPNQGIPTVSPSPPAPNPPPPAPDPTLPSSDPLPLSSTPPSPPPSSDSTLPGPTLPPFDPPPSSSDPPPTPHSPPPPSSNPPPNTSLRGGTSGPPNKPSLGNNNGSSQTSQSPTTQDQKLRHAGSSSDADVLSHSPTIAKSGSRGSFILPLSSAIQVAGDPSPPIPPVNTGLSRKNSQGSAGGTVSTQAARAAKDAEETSPLRVNQEIPSPTSYTGPKQHEEAGSPAEETRQPSTPAKHGSSLNQEAPKDVEQPPSVDKAPSFQQSVTTHLSSTGIDIASTPSPDPAAKAVPVLNPTGNASQSTVKDNDSNTGSIHLEDRPGPSSTDPPAAPSADIAEEGETDHEKGGTSLSSESAHRPTSTAARKETTKHSPSNIPDPATTTASGVSPPTASNSTMQKVDKLTETQQGSVTNAETNRDTVKENKKSGKDEESGCCCLIQ